MEPSKSEKIEVKVKTGKRLPSSPSQDSDGGFASDMNIKTASKSTSSKTIEPITEKEDSSSRIDNDESSPSALAVEPSPETASVTDGGRVYGCSLCSKGSSVLEEGIE